MNRGILAPAVLAILGASASWAGEAAAGYSISSGSDHWKLFKKRTEDRPIQPVGLTSPEEAEAFYREIQTLLEEQGGPAHFWYPSRDMGDLCDGLDRDAAMPAALQCTAQEIDWATHGHEAVESMWIPLDGRASRFVSGDDRRRSP